MSSNMFDQVLNDATGIQDKLLGPTYPYWKNIKTPAEIGMSDKGDLQTMGNDINGLIQYVEVLVTGKGASSTGGPLGNKFFLQTGGKCMDVESKKPVDRFIYVNNVPQGNVPFISSGLGVNFSEFKGLIPGTISNLNVLNPFTIMQSFMSGSTPDCAAVTLQTVNINNNTGSDTKFVTLVDLKNMDPCSFPNGQNKFSNKSCKQTFVNRKEEEETSASLPNDPIVQFYFASLSIIGIYVLYRIMMKKR